MQILVVDGEKGERRAIVEAIVELEGVAVQGAVADHASALRAIAEWPPDVVITGTTLLDGDGMRLVEAVRSREHMPAIVVIGHDASRAEWKRHLDAGADRFVECEPGFEELRAVVGSMVTRPKPNPADVTLKVIGRMAVGVADEVAQQLTSIGMTLAMLERAAEQAPLGGAPADKLLWGEAHAAVEQTTRLVSTLLGYVPGQQADTTSLELGALTRSALARAARLISPKVEVAVEIRGGLPLVRGVASELEQLVLDLVLDANDAMPDGGDLHVRVAPTSTSAILVEVVHSGAFVEYGARHDVVTSTLRRHHAVMRVSRREPAGVVVRVLLPT
ncbi:MAG: response regulator [Proteobacteria bacterium]|nr:response regulator [Pseudomonadota bacterium]